ncbi:Hypp5771 [Branchiostoma lanceolatum]|uniref:Hypp5771 protein n=1 Tax=Branchiostoma lanceolatum TaxID=7740 RepID=A0A8J9W3G6_BRALA|nr:Hypp5771 [Branchiostoma lanceolatum]
MKITIVLAVLSAVLVVHCTNFEEMDKKIFLGEDGQSVVVLDNVLSDEAVSALLMYASVFTKWEYTHVTSSPEMFQKPPFISPLSGEMMEKTSLWEAVEDTLEKLTGKQEEYYPYDIHSTILRRYDRLQPKAHCEDGDFMAKMYLNQYVGKNDYGHLTLYNGKHGNVTNTLTAVHPKQGRLVIWPCSVPAIEHPPSMGYKQLLHVLTLKITTNEEKFGEYQKQVEGFKLLSDENEKAPFALSHGEKLQKEVTDLDLDKLQTQRFYDSRGRVIAVYDDVVGEEDLEALHSYVNNMFQFLMYSPHDTGLLEDNDNVQWITALNVESFVKSRVWNIVSRVADHVSNRTNWYPYDVSMNVIRSADYTRIHEDCETDEYEYTFLLYLNKDWESNKYGETVFVEYVEDDVWGGKLGPGSEQYEMVAAVRPRYGRIVIFRNIIPHSARPPVGTFDGARYTFAVKVSHTRTRAIAKTLLESMENVPAQDEEGEQLVEQLKRREFDRPRRDVPADFLDSKLQEAMEHRKNFIQGIREKAEDILMTKA